MSPALDKIPDSEAPCPQEFSIVGIGASAGGLEACSALLRSLPADTGLAFVVVQHLDPEHESLLPTLLARVANIPVTPVHDDMAVEPNQVYVMPPNREIVFSGGLLRLMPRERTPGGTHMPIDRFFHSLAENCRHRAIGVVLSGTGSDGALGLETIKAEGGFTFAQDEQSAKFGGMPHSAVATGSVDFVLSPDGIAQEIARIAKDSYAARVEGTDGDEEVPAASEAAGDRGHLRDILAFLHEAAGIDFTQYRYSTIQRRILRRMAIHHFNEPERYRRFLAETPGEVALLCDEMIPRVTRFFRDPDVFAALKRQVFPQFLTDGAKNRPIRIWVPGCASGEEAYAIAISLLEFIDENGADVRIQIFGTDLSALAIQKARKGFYPRAISADVSPERLQRFFVKRDGGYQIGLAAREICIFAGHDLIADAPYSKLDLISCRNVLIYLDSIQTRIIPMFHHALKPGGFLMLGVMETARRFPDLFTPVDNSAQIYSKKPAAGHPPGSWGPAKAATAAKPRTPGDVREEPDAQKRADRAVLAKYAPGGVIVNENWQVLHVRGKVSPWLEPASGKMSINILSMAKRSGLAPDLADALSEAKARNAAVRREHIVVPHERAIVNLQVIPLGVEEEPLFLVLLEELPDAGFMSYDEAAMESRVPTGEFLKLQQELIATRERLLRMVDSHQQYSEEAQSAQEESLSNLEEAQSFNEELETAREELQSTNEELSTVNDELQTRNTDLQQTRDFASAIVETVREPLVVLDKALYVRTANRAFYQSFRLTERDTESRFIYDLARGTFDVPALRSLLGEALLENRADPEKRDPGDIELDREFPGAGRKILRISARRLKGTEMILLSMDDITARRRDEGELRRVQEELRQGQKMEAIGRLAGGVAHDFNNVLTGILGFSEMLMGSLGADTDAYSQASEIRKAGERAATLTQQLLAFSRRQVLHPQVLNLNTVILDLDQMLRRLIGADIALDKVLGKELWPMQADPGQMSQVILNLALNARDAMPHGGVLTIRTANTLVKEEETRGLAPGSYVSLTVADSGTGMDPETQRHIFEPFYTTKPEGSGTGLGLATVFGILQQSGGSIRVGSELGLGSTFWVDFPRVESAPAVEAPRVRAEMPGGAETVLVVEDEDVVRGLAVQVLRRQGYTVLQASQAGEALAVCHSHPEPIGLFLTDIVMPGGLNGRQLAEQALALRPGMRVLLVSGHTTDELVHYGVRKGVPFLQKPYTLQQLARKVRDVLDGGPAEPMHLVA